MLPLMVDVKDRNVIIVGGGKIAYRKLMVFLRQGAKVKVISPTLIDEMKGLYEKNQFEWAEKAVSRDDLHDAFIIVAATDNKDVNSWIRSHANHNQLVNVVDDAELGNIQIPSFQQKGKLTVSVSTDGASPILAKEICYHFFNQLDESFLSELEELSKTRQEIKTSSLSLEEKKTVLKKLAQEAQKKIFLTQ
ncbi:precorrin-2 dehydrogenase/sirohydrochlorin ferrochelatase family protein [Peribacillus tepidiphilus]|uniref:precorrin-2 dehydrogenase/sirohydrochlorin ferrochelatase family protein n=1 Tax=Peribacillus tepidiphilus TaxID=2652445 RepID=UPI0012924CF0|nr:NAD(P)-dependent oxidoreductase [Peribacillus tepidiphilus]